jgi:hypothetical protein
MVFTKEMKGKKFEDTKDEENKKKVPAFIKNKIKKK